MADRKTIPLLLCRVASCTVGLPLEHVVETMRPLAIEPVSATGPEFVKGVSVIRGTPIPVVDAGHLLGGPETRPGRLVTVRAGNRSVALLFDEVAGIRLVPTESLQQLPLLLQAAQPDAVAAIGTLDAELLVVLSTACVVPEDLPDYADTTGVST
jgi:purine-binding chemotaxis protein CheW